MPLSASEQIVINANQQPGVDLVAVYPNEGSLWQDHPLALLEASTLERCESRDVPRVCQLHHVAGSAAVDSGARVIGPPI